MLELEQECITGKEVREIAEKEKEAPRKFTMNSLAAAFADLNKLLKKFKDMSPNSKRFSLIAMFIVHYLLTKQI